MLADFNQIERCFKKMLKKEAVLTSDQRKFKIVYTAWWYGSCNFSDRMYSI